MKNPNDSYWTSGSDVHLPEYDQKIREIPKQEVIAKRGIERRTSMFFIQLDGIPVDRRKGEDRRRLVSQRERDVLMGEA